MDDEKDGQKPPTQLAMPAALAIGAGIGAAMFVAADNPVWIGVGAGVGVAIGAARQGHKGS